MSSFLRKTAVALLIALLFHLAAGFMADGTTDEYYLRFTTGKQRSMILGGSRAAQGLHPSVFNGIDAPSEFEGPIYNFSFTIAHSPYGPTYQHAIKEKLDATAKNGLFILQVDPWLLSDPKDSASGTEAERALGEQLTWNVRPNYEYLTRYWDRGWGALGHWPQRDADTTSEVLADGRLRLHVPMDTATVRRRTENKIRTYREEYLPGRSLSPERMDHLGRTIRLLRQHGRVALVRLPVCKAIADMEDSFAPDLNASMAEMAVNTGASYIRLDTMAATFTDGNHLDEVSGLRVTEALRKATQERAQ